MVSSRPVQIYILKLSKSCDQVVFPSQYPPLQTRKMTSIISEILKIQVDLSFTLASSTFAKLRAAAVKGGVKEQYYGLNMDKSDELFWIIRLFRIFLCNRDSTDSMLYHRLAWRFEANRVQRA